jgi:phage terminase large subunit-like protein
METNYHLTGEYPDWWTGRRFNNPIRMWVGGPTSEHVRDNAQRILFGPAGEEGTGTLPAHRIKAIERSRGIKNAIDYALIGHVSGGISYLNFKSYDQDTDTWSGDTLAAVWFDEEPPLDKYTEGLTRTNTGDNGRPGFVYLTLTPLLGMTKVARRFHPRPEERDAVLVRMGLKDALHYTEENIRDIASTYPAYERKARVEGFPQLGEGAVFPVEKKEYVIEPPQRERWWLHLGGIDFGWDHPCGLVECAWDRENDVVMFLRAWRERQKRTPEVASVMRRWGDWMPWAWPHDGWVHDRQSGLTTKALFEEEGVNMLPDHATFEDGKSGLEAGVLEMNDRIMTGRLKVSSACEPLIEEMEMYHRQGGKIVKLDDDLISAARYALMMRRFGALSGGEVRFPKLVGGPRDYQPFR